ncbi:opacity protein-like surface antigen [Rhizobium sp. BK049]|nr:opacity protein-like surface antigen [Rhizobium sp. BK049]
MKMITRYTSLATMTAAVLSLLALSPASATELAQAQQQPPAQGQAPMQGQGGTGAASPVSDQKLEAFAVAYVQVDKVRQEYSAKIDATKDQASKQKLQDEAKKQMVETVQASPDISVEEYSSILTAAQSDPALAKKVLEKIGTPPPAQQQR